MTAKARKSAKRSPAQSVTTGTVIRMEKPVSSRKPKKTVSKVVVEEVKEVSVTGFVDFLKEYSVVTLAVGFMIAAQAQVVVKQLITSFVDPAYALLFDGTKLSAKTTVVEWHDRTASFGWGAVIYTLIDFIFVLALIYIIIKFLQLDRLKKEEDKKDKK